MTASPAFRELVTTWGSAAAEAWGYPPLEAGWRERVESRLPPGVRAAVARAAADGTLITVGGHQFRLVGLAPGKGPYSLFSRSERREPAPNWEYFVQVAEYHRLRRAPEGGDLQIDFEDDLMDISVRQDGNLIWCIEVKEKAADLDKLFAGIVSYGASLPDEGPDRGNDPLRKAKYIQRHRPRWFSLMAIGRHMDFSVEHDESSGGFRLVPDVVPIG